jgi:hypothetical protein
MALSSLSLQIPQLPELPLIALDCLGTRCATIGPHLAGGVLRYTQSNKRMKLTSASPSRALVRVGRCARAARADARGRSQLIRSVRPT